ncbi:hypothetical protein MCOR34_010176 [Pyricularia oryzae]|nr:hypothetical protein MCOR34_010176 [Pyricularia oryzae]
MAAKFVACLAGIAAVASGQELITDDTFFYGQSPPVYPSPNATGTGDWSEAIGKAKALVGQMTLEEKVLLTGGVTSNTGCAGWISNITRLGFPGMCLQDAGNGLRSTDFVTAWSSGISVGASWNRDLALQRAEGMGSEYRTKGVNILLGPVVGPLGRIANGGRNWEGFSNDPYLCGQLAAETVKGIQSQGVAASTKHFIANEQEDYRNPSTATIAIGNEGQDQNSAVNISALSSNIDDKTMHELYLWPFVDTVKAGTGNIMCSYQRINNSYGCQNSAAQNGLLKTELGFQGFVVSDWYAQHAGVGTALAGMDMVMPSGIPMWDKHLVEAVNNGSVPEVRLDDMVTRILSNWYKFNQDKDFVPGVGMFGDMTKSHKKVVGRNPAFREAVYQSAVQSHVLVKNTKNALPLKNPELISLFGYAAKATDQQNIGTPGWNLGSQSVNCADRFFGCNGTKSQIGPLGMLYSGGGSGGNMPAYGGSPFEALSVRARKDGTHMLWDFSSFNPTINSNSDACIVVGNAWATEGWDRPGLHDDFTDGLVLNVAANCSNTIVVLQNAGVRLVDQFADHPNVTAIIFAHLPGEDAGYALTDLLYGEENFSGKMPYSVPHNETDYRGLQNQSIADGMYERFPQSDFSEGVFIDYRAFDKEGVEPRYEFGFGLSYTNFSYSDVQAAWTGPELSAAEYPSGPIQEGGHVDLFDVVARVSAKVANTGDVAGAEAAQLYVGIPEEGAPVRQLRGFAKPSLEPGAEATVEFELTRRDLSGWDVAAQAWRLHPGEYKLWVGGSSRNLPLEASLQLTR